MPPLNGSPPIEKAGPRQETGQFLTTHRATHSTSVDIATVANRHKRAAREQARRGLITWDQFRRFCAEVDRIKRDRQRLARDRVGAPSDADIKEYNTQRATAALMRDHTGRSNENDCHIDRSARKNTRAARRAAVVDSVRNAPELSDREHGRRVGVDHKTVAAVRSRLIESGEIPHFIRRVDPRTGNQSQPAVRRAKPPTPASWAVAL